MKKKTNPNYFSISEKKFEICFFFSSEKKIKTKFVFRDKKKLIYIYQIYLYFSEKKN